MADNREGTTPLAQHCVQAATTKHVAKHIGNGYDATQNINIGTTSSTCRTQVILQIHTHSGNKRVLHNRKGTTTSHCHCHRHEELRVPTSTAKVEAGNKSLEGIGSDHLRNAWKRLLKSVQVMVRMKRERGGQGK